MAYALQNNKSLCFAPGGRQDKAFSLRTLKNYRL